MVGAEDPTRHFDTSKPETMTPPTASKRHAAHCLEYTTLSEHFSIQKSLLTEFVITMVKPIVIS